MVPWDLDGRGADALIQWAAQGHISQAVHSMTSYLIMVSSKTPPKCFDLLFDLRVG